MKNFRRNQRVKVIDTDGHGFKLGNIVTVTSFELGSRFNFVSCEGLYEGYMIFQTLDPSQLQPIFSYYYEQIISK